MRGEGVASPLVGLAGGVLESEEGALAARRRRLHLKHWAANTYTLAPAKTLQHHSLP